ncbi:unnamed protein product [Cuscuta campestris]|uniref:Uncharacterized protein n=1 Tax=Cuscuta campestris TaxID=132261 RepID=A0A484NDV2_9ASTE|nr:unnamed protein product [Cuscuta campestris]
MGLSKFGICRILASHRCLELTHRWCLPSDGRIYPSMGRLPLESEEGPKAAFPAMFAFTHRWEVDRKPPSYPGRPDCHSVARALVPDIVIPALFPLESSVRPISTKSLIHMGFGKRPCDTTYQPDQGTGSPLYMLESMPTEGASSPSVPRPLPATFDELTAAFGDLRTSIDSRFQRYEERRTAFERTQETR